MINIIYTILCIISLCIGYFLGSKQEHKTVIQNPIKTIKEKIENKKQNEQINEQLEELNKIYYNLEHYDGTKNGQKEVKGIEIGLFR